MQKKRCLENKYTKFNRANSGISGYSPRSRSQPTDHKLRILHLTLGACATGWNLDKGSLSKTGNCHLPRSLTSPGVDFSDQEICRIVLRWYFTSNGFGKCTGNLINNRASNQKVSKTITLVR